MWSITEFLTRLLIMVWDLRLWFGMLLLGITWIVMAELNLCRNPECAVCREDM